MVDTSVTPDNQRVRRFGQPELILVTVLAIVLCQRWLSPFLDGDRLATWSTIFVAIVIQSIPFLVGGILLAAVISTLLSERVLQRAVPKNPVFGVPVVGLAGVALPACECASVPVANSLMRRGIQPAVALSFLLAAPAVNPVVLVSTAVAFPGRPDIVFARFTASLLTAVVVGWFWLWRGGSVPMPGRGEAGHAGNGGVRAFAGSVRHDFVHVSGFLILGAAIAAAVNTFVPMSIINSLAGQVVVSVAVLALFAFVIALCSEADAFVAASLTAFSDTAKLAFMVVGPAMDVKLAALGWGQFGADFAKRFVPLVFAVAVASASLIGWLVL
ncbi:MAG: permease [Nocardioides sp.]